MRRILRNSTCLAICVAVALEFYFQATGNQVATDVVFTFTTGLMAGDLLRDLAARA